MILELPEVRAWSIADLEKRDTGDFHLELDEGQLLVPPAAWYPWNSRITVRLVAYGVYRLERTVPLSKLEQE